MDKKKGIRKHEKGNPYNEENRVDAKLIEGDLRVQTIYRILDWYKEGLMRATIIEQLKEEGQFSESVIDDLLYESSSIIYEQFSSESTEVIGLHLKRYDRQIKSLFNKDYNRIALKIRFKVKSMAYFSILETLYQKEKLLNLHSKQTIIRFNQRNNINIPNPEADKKESFDISTLTLEEKVDFLKLIEKCSPRNINNLGVILRPKEIKEEETVDIEHEEVVNIEQIEQVNVEGKDVFTEKPPLTIIDVKERLRQALEIKAKEAFKEAGSSTADEGKLSRLQ